MKALRNHVVAHHGRDLDTHQMKNEQLYDPSGRTANIVDEISELLHEDKSETKDLMEVGE